jgi:photosynthetic reaction center cytochrome c subunit
MKSFRTSLALLGVASLLGLAACEDQAVVSQQTGYRGTGMAQVFKAGADKDRRAVNVVPEAQPPAEAGGPKATEAYQNVQVLTDLSEAEFTRLMLAITEWVSPNEGCNYCHNPDNLAEDKLYTKIVARKMLQMTRHINADFKAHVAQTGVTCYTCHRGQPVPANVWYNNPGLPEAGGMARSRDGQNIAGSAVNQSSLPTDPFTPLLAQPDAIRVVSRSVLAEPTPQIGTKKTEVTYGLMMHLSEGLGVNCTFCHNSRSFMTWEESSPQRVTAWHGLRMTADINTNYIVPLTATFPPNRLGPTGDVAKVNCATCHQGVSKPLYGVSMLQDYVKELGGAPAAK